MKKLYINAALAFGLSFWCACGRQSAEDTEITHAPFTNHETSTPTVHTDESFAKVIQVGMSQEAVSAIFGSPRKTTTLDTDYVCRDYSFEIPDIPGPRRTVVSGVAVYFKDKKVVRWVAEHGSVGGYRAGERPLTVPPKSGSETPSGKVAELSFWSVSDIPVEGGRFIDTEKMPKLGYIGNEPSFRTRKLVSLREGREVNSDSQGREINTPTLYFQLSDTDSKAFEKLCESNQGKRVLIMVGEIPVSAPRLFGVISNGRFQIGLQAGKPFEEARDKLAELLPKK